MAGGALGLCPCHPMACVVQCFLLGGVGWCKGGRDIPPSTGCPSRPLFWSEAVSDFTLNLADELPAWCFQPPLALHELCSYLCPSLAWLSQEVVFHHRTSFSVTEKFLSLCLCGVTMEGLAPADALPSLGQGPSSVCFAACEMLIPQPDISSCCICGWFKHLASSCCSPGCLARGQQWGS